MRCTWALFAGAALSACAAVPPETTASPPKPARAEYRWEGYSDKPVEARLGPHRYMIPMNYFRDQIGPDFQGNFSLWVQWPDLQPLPPGKRSGQDLDTFRRAISISPYYIDRLPIEDRLERSVRPLSSENSLSYQDPEERLDLRDKQPQHFGLTPYYVNREKFVAYEKQRERSNGYASTARLEKTDDWYLAHDTQGQLTTVIKCDSHLEPDGLIIEGDRLFKDGARNTICAHQFVILDDSILVSIGYMRVFLKDWKRIEDKARELFKQYQLR
jgi:hypothetical protein